MPASPLETISGIAAIWFTRGIQMSGSIVAGTDATGNTVGGSTGKIQSLTEQRTSEKAYVDDEIGNHVGRADYNTGATVKVTIIPTGDTVTAARTNSIALN